MLPEDHELELLETYLDGELPAEQVAMLRTRLDAEPELSAALGTLQRQRALRAQMFSSLEGTDAEIQAIARRVKQEITRDVARGQVWARRARKLQVFTAAAACLLVGITLGWLGRSNFNNDDHPLPEGMPPLPGSISTVSQPVVGNQAPPIRQSRSMPLPLATGGYKVTMSDGQGRVVAERRFERYEDALDYSRSFGEFDTRTRPFGQQDRVKDQY